MKHRKPTLKLTLLTRLRKTAPAPRIHKRRRASKKLVTNLDSLADALPDISTDGALPERATDGERGKGKGGGEGGGAQKMKMKQKSLPSRRGAGRKKERVVAMERERFARNLAVMAAAGRMAGGGGGGEEGGSADRWAAIRGFIGERMERRAGEEVMVGKG